MWLHVQTREIKNPAMFRRFASVLQAKSAQQALFRGHGNGHFAVLIIWSLSGRSSDLGSHSRGFIKFLHSDDSCRHCEQLGLQRFILGNGHAAEYHRCLELGTQDRNMILWPLRNCNDSLTSCGTHFQHFYTCLYNTAQTRCSWVVGSARMCTGVAWWLRNSMARLVPYLGCFVSCACW